MWPIGGLKWLEYLQKRQRAIGERKSKKKKKRCFKYPKTPRNFAFFFSCFSFLCSNKCRWKKWRKNNIEEKQRRKMHARRHSSADGCLKRGRRREDHRLKERRRGAGKAWTERDRAVVRDGQSRDQRNCGRTRRERRRRERPKRERREGVMQRLQQKRNFRGNRRERG